MCYYVYIARFFLFQCGKVLDNQPYSVKRSLTDIFMQVCEMKHRLENSLLQNPLILYVYVIIIYNNFI